MSQSPNVPNPAASPANEAPLPSDHAFIAVGSNIDPERNIAAALIRLRGAVEVLATSTFYRTAPLRRPDQPDFLNGVWRIRTGRASRALKFDCLRVIEEALGRKRGADRHAARTIDLDLILHGERIIDEPGLCLPDPDIIDRPFIAVPLLELSPGLCLPSETRPLSDIPATREAGSLEPCSTLTEALRRMVYGSTSS